MTFKKHGLESSGVFVFCLFGYFFNICNLVTQEFCLQKTNPKLITAFKMEMHILKSIFLCCFSMKKKEKKGALILKISAHYKTALPLQSQKVFTIKNNRRLNYNVEFLCPLT